MPLGTDELIEIERVLAEAKLDASSLSELRRRFPQLAVTRCDASDVTERPFRSFPHFDLHLIDGCDRCVQITTDPARAIGILLAARSTGP
ncbi:hypothetical protein CQ14_26195 [Bradyrhizobium lablabi]|uniref:Uncharacterized protein n=1 Tax=Bradyrhizobium lablabi TaxID=722472 RepID=A0A0R3MBF2_9BRAD|nr:hypothetical protein [Bradyrhizobium lablabi]KRR17634.1 hypothetical protein CQ14_26195 [Bradyrhizobium lablabi]